MDNITTMSSIEFKNTWYERIRDNKNLPKIVSVALSVFSLLSIVVPLISIVQYAWQIHTHQRTCEDFFKSYVIKRIESCNNKKYNCHDDCKELSEKTARLLQSIITPFNGDIYKSEECIDEKIEKSIENWKIIDERMKEQINEMFKNDFEKKHQLKEKETFNEIPEINRQKENLIRSFISTHDSKKTSQKMPKENRQNLISTIDSEKNRFKQKEPQEPDENYKNNSTQCYMDLKKTILDTWISQVQKYYQSTSAGKILRSEVSKRLKEAINRRNLSPFPPDWETSNDDQIKKLSKCLCPVKQEHRFLM